MRTKQKIIIRIKAMIIVYLENAIRADWFQARKSHENIIKFHKEWCTHFRGKIMIQTRGKEGALPQNLYDLEVENNNIGLPNIYFNIHPPSTTRGLHLYTDYSTFARIGGWRRQQCIESNAYRCSRLIMIIFLFWKKQSTDYDYFINLLLYILSKHPRKEAESTQAFNSHQVRISLAASCDAAAGQRTSWLRGRATRWWT